MTSLLPVYLTSREQPLRITVGYSTDPFMAAYRLRRQSKPAHPSKIVWTEDKFRALLESAPDAMVIVDASGAVTEAKVQKTSGFKDLDDAAVNVVKTRWRFPAGKAQWLIWPCQFVLQ